MQSYFVYFCEFVRNVQILPVQNVLSYVDSFPSCNCNYYGALASVVSHVNFAPAVKTHRAYSDLRVSAPL